MLEKLFATMAEKAAPIIAERLMALLPVIAAAVAKAVVDELVKHLPNFTMPAFDIGQVADQVRDDVNQSIHDLDIPVLSDLFDLTDFFHRGTPG